MLKRLLVTIPIFMIAFALTKMDFAIIWCYFGLSNQMLATIVLLTITVYIKKQGKTYWIILIPAAFMTTVVTTYIFVAPEGFGLDYTISFVTGIIVSILLSPWLLFSKLSEIEF